MLKRSEQQLKQIATQEIHLNHSAAHHSVQTMTTGQDWQNRVGRDGVNQAEPRVVVEARTGHVNSRRFEGRIDLRRHQPGEAVQE